MAASPPREVRRAQRPPVTVKPTMPTVVRASSPTIISKTEPANGDKPDDKSGGGKQEGGVLGRFIKK